MMVSKIWKEIKDLSTGEKIFLLFLLFSQVYYFYRYAFRYGSPLSPPGYSLTPTFLQQGKYALVLFFFLILAFYCLRKYGLKEVARIFSKQKIWWLMAAFVGYTGFSLFKFGFDINNFAFTQTLKMLFVVPAVFLVPLIWKNKSPFGVIKIFLIFSLAYHILYDLVMIGNFYIFGRLPGLHLSQVVGRFGAGWDDPNGFAAFAVLLIVVLLALPEELIKRKTHLFVVLLGLLVFLLLFTFSLTGVIGLILSLGILSVLKSFSFKKVWVIPVAVLMFAGLVYSLGYFDIIYDNKFASSRIHLSTPATGEAGGQTGYLEFLTPIFGSFGGPRFHENFYLQTFLNFGLIGLAATLLILVVTVFKAYEGWWKTDFSKDLEKKIFFTTSLVYLPTFAFMNLGIPLFQVFPINLFAWVVIGLVWVLSSQLKNRAFSAKDLGDQTILSQLVRLGQKESSLEQFRSLASAHQYFRLYQLFRSYVPKSAKVLDWGAGNGHFSYWLVTAGYKASGYGFEGYTYKSWLGDASYQYTKGDPKSPTKLPYPNESFEAVASVGVLEHVRQTGGNELGSLKEINRILKPGGVFVCYHLPNKYSWIEFLVRFFPSKHHHRFRYTNRDIKKLVGASGLKLIDIDRYGFLPRNFLGRLPKFLRMSDITANSWDFIDAILGKVFSVFCQNYYFVARRKR